jgi:hypothetical protein
MAEHLDYILEMIRNGHLNHVCSTQADVPMALAAVDDAIAADYGYQGPTCSYITGKPNCSSGSGRLASG